MAAPLFKRPIPRMAHPAALTFVSSFRNGAMVTDWVESTSNSRIPSGCPGRVGEIVDAMNKGLGAVAVYKPTPWTPPISYEFMASKMSEEQGEAYLKRCKTWFDEHPPAVPRRVKPVLPYDTELVAKYFSKLTVVPDVSELAKMWQSAGLPEWRIQKIREWHEKMEATSSIRQAQIDAIFGPEEVKKIKKAPKVIKAVKKRA